ncbi:hypothetical protein EV127DRAFT_504913 [Xylaria flabelliformis]|nr:hypothetical protein EV127DRAFT_504913 [Xylaria flabelliformis]
MAASNSSSISNANSILRNTIEDFGLTREPTVWEPKDTSFIDSYLVYASLSESSSHPSMPEWSSYKITRPRGSKSPTLLNGYAVSPSHHAYVTFCVQLTAAEASSSPRITAMRYRDMIADNYISACSPSALAKLRWLGVANILHGGSRSTFRQVFRLAGRNILSRSAVEVYPSIDLKDRPELRDLLLKDPFTRGVLALLHHHAGELGNAFVKRFVFISEGYEDHEHSGEPSPLELRFNLVVELGRPGGEGGDASAMDDLKAPLANL